MAFLIARFYGLFILFSLIVLAGCCPKVIVQPVELLRLKFYFSRN